MRDAGMIPAGRAGEKRQLLVGAGLGLYATVVALVPGLAAKAVLAVPLVAIPLFWYLIGTSTAWLSLFFLCALLTPPLPIALGDNGPHGALVLAAAGIFIGLLRLWDWRVFVYAPFPLFLGPWGGCGWGAGLGAVSSGVTGAVLL